MEDSFYDKISTWLSGEMSEEARKAFTKEMDRDPELAREVQLAKEALTAVQEKEVIAFRQQMDTIMAESTPLPSQPKSYWKSALIIGGLLLLGWLGYQLLTENKTETPAPPNRPIALYHTYFAPPEMLIINGATRNDPAEEDAGSLKQKVVALIDLLNNQFQQKNYSEASHTLDSLKRIDSDQLFFQNKDLHFSEGMLQLLTGHPEQAISSFKEANKNMTWENVQWYQAAAHIKMEQWETAQVILESLSAKNSPVYSGKADEVLENMGAS